ncbi:MAG: mechanosensitive ion channel [Phycisphaerales bacterium]|nr:MAG: mechanosensitive ion channel [Phycisphaerales bacterium]
MAATCLLSVQTAAGQQVEPPAQPRTQAPNGVPTAEVVQQRISELEDAAATDPDARARLDLLRQALDALQQSEQLTARIAEFQELARGAPERIKEIQARLAEAMPEFKPEYPPDATMEFLRQKLSEAETAVATAAGMKENVEAEDATRKGRREQIPSEIAAATQALEEIQQRLSAPPAAEESAGLTQARRWKLLAEQQRAQLQINLLQEEIRSYDARRELLPIRRQLRERELIEAERRVRAWQNELTAKGQREAADSADKARQAIKDVEEAEQTDKPHPLVVKLMQENVELTSKRKELADRHKRMVDGKVNERQNLLSKYVDEFGDSQNRVDQAGLTHAVGALLQTRRTALPDVREYRKNIRERRDEIRSLQLDLYGYEDRQLSKEDFDREVANLSAQIEEPWVTDEKKLETEEALREQLKLQNDKYLPELIGTINDYLKNVLIKLDQVERKLIDTVVEYDDYLAERVLWIRSCERLGWEDGENAAGAVSWLLDSDSWLATSRAMWRDFRSNWPPTLGLFAFLAVLAGLQPRLKARLRDIVTQIKKPTTDRYAYTVEAAMWTILAAALWPVLLWFISIRISSSADWLSGDPAAFAGAVAPAIGRTAWLLFLLELLRQVFRPRGLASAHFRWPEATRQTVRRYLPWIMAVSVPATALVLVTENQDTEQYKASLGRIVFMVACLLMAVLIWRVLSPAGGLVRDYLTRHSGGWLDRLRYVWFPLVLAAPVALAIASAMGYHYSALHVAERLFNTIALIVLATVLFGLLLRWLFVNQRRLAVEQALKKYAAAEKEKTEAADQAQPGPEAEPATEMAPVLEEPEIDFDAISVQTRRLLRSVIVIALFIGILFVWADVLPALGVLRDVVIWSEAGTVVETVAAAGEGTEVVQTFQPSVVTLADLGLAVVIFALTVIISRNIPGLLEIVILQRLPFTPSGRYGIKTIVQYLIFVVGLILTFNAIGIGWSKVQWLIAAMTVGLGFGLQEIFANFVSGLIILFERPVRVGDTVTVSNTNGTVSRIRIRATTITDWDRKELIIPNKEFVTGQVVNWSLSDSILRVTIAVGIAYGSDTALARDLLLKVAQDHPKVLDDPPPKALFLGFGESSLDFELRVFIPSIDYMLQVKSDLNYEIDQAFRKAGVEIAFPQRDLHIRSVQADLPVSVHRQGKSDEPSS